MWGSDLAEFLGQCSNWINASGKARTELALFHWQDLLGAQIRPEARDDVRNSELGQHLYKLT